MAPSRRIVIFAPCRIPKYRTIRSESVFYRSESEDNVSTRSESDTVSPIPYEVHRFESGSDNQRFFCKSGINIKETNKRLFPILGAGFSSNLRERTFYRCYCFIFTKSEARIIVLRSDLTEARFQSNSETEECESDTGT